MAMHDGGTRNEGSTIPAIAVGALTYLVLSFLRTELNRHSTALTSNHWYVPFDASLAFLIALTTGFVAASMYRQREMAMGFCACAVGEIARGIIKLLVAVYGAGFAVAINLPGAAVLDIFTNALPSGILGAAGGAVAVVLLRNRSK